MCVLHDPCLLLMCKLSVQATGVGLCVCVSQPHRDSHVLFSEITHLSSSPTSLVLLLLSVHLAWAKYITADLCFVPNQQDFPQIFPRLDKTALEFKSTTVLIRP